MQHQGLMASGCRAGGPQIGDFSQHAAPHAASGPRLPLMWQQFFDTTRGLGGQMFLNIPQIVERIGSIERGRAGSGS